VPYHITRSLNHIIALLRRQSPTVQAVSTARPAGSAMYVWWRYT
jgi:hypothetical protein